MGDGGDDDAYGGAEAKGLDNKGDLGTAYRGKEGDGGCGCWDAGGLCCDSDHGRRLAAGEGRLGQGPSKGTESIGDHLTGNDIAVG